MYVKPFGTMIPTFVCVVPGCKNNSLNTKNVRFHRFPFPPDPWLNAIENEHGSINKLEPNPFGVISAETVCSKHFRKQDYVEDQDSAIFKNHTTHCTLKPDVVPSLFIPSRVVLLLEGGDLEPGEIKIKGGVDNNNDDEDDDEEEKSYFTHVKIPEKSTTFKRNDSSLGHLCQLFMNHMNPSPGALADLNDVAEKMNIAKRRIYDITNVLEGIKLIKKRSKNVVQWVGWPSGFIDDGQMKRLEVEEKLLDEAIKNMKKSLTEMYGNNLLCKSAYLMYEDLRSLPVFEDQAVFVIRGPPETKLEVAHPKEAFQIHIKSTAGPVEVMMCTENIPPHLRKKQTFAAGDYSYIRGPATVSTISSFDNTCHNYAKSNPSATSLPEQSPHSPHSKSPKSTLVLLPHETQSNSSPPSPPVVTAIKEEMTDLNITPDQITEALKQEPDQSITDVHMTDLSLS